MVDELIIYQKLLESYKYAYGVVKQFPKSEKFDLAADIKKGYREAIRLVIVANRQKRKEAELYNLDTEIMLLKAWVRIGYELGFMAVKKYENLSKQLVEIGKICGGWIRKQR
jgi:hypothetical protein